MRDLQGGSEAEARISRVSHPPFVGHVPRGLLAMHFAGFPELWACLPSSPPAPLAVEARYWLWYLLAGSPLPNLQNPILLLLYGWKC